MTKKETKAWGHDNAKGWIAGVYIGSDRYRNNSTINHVHKKDLRRDFVFPFIENASVLDLACSDMSYHNLHCFIDKHSKYCDGVDLHPVNRDIIKGDVTKLKKFGSFDVVNACAILEHVSNVDGFFKSIDRNLKDNGFLIIDVPNAYCLPNSYGYKPMSESTDHVAWYDLCTLRELLRRKGYKIIAHKHHSPLHNTCRSRLFHLLCKLFNERWNTDLIVCAKRMD